MILVKWYFSSHSSMSKRPIVVCYLGELYKFLRQSNYNSQTSQPMFSKRQQLTFRQLLILLLTYLRFHRCHTDYLLRSWTHRSLGPQIRVFIIFNKHSQYCKLKFMGINLQPGLCFFRSIFHWKEYPVSLTSCFSSFTVVQVILVMFLKSKVMMWCTVLQSIFKSK